MIHNNIILFDGICNFCNQYIQFLIRQDTKAIFRFASLQSKIGQQLLKEHQLPIEKMDSIVFIENGKAYTHSTAILRIAKRLGFGGQLLYIFILIPRRIRDGIYVLMAQNRYHFLGKTQTCLIPTLALKARFLE